MKPLLFLGLLAAIGSAGLAFMVRTSLKEARLHKDSQNRKALAIHNELREKNIPAITTLNDQIAEVSKNAKNEDLSTKAEKTATAAKQEEVEAAKKETESLINQKQQIQEEINRIAGGVGTPEEIAAKMETLKKENDAKVLEIEQINKELEIAKRATVENEQQLARLRQGQADRTRTIGLSSRTSTVSAVNSELGFVIVSSGRNQGVTTESRLLVKRGTQYIGKLNVTQVNANQTVADFSAQSVTPGLVIQPGDEVVFDNSAH